MRAEYTAPSLSEAHGLDRRLLDVDSLGADGIDLVLAHAERIRSAVETLHAASLRTSLQGKVVVNLFYEASTRTRVSFELAARRLGAEVINIAESGSSITKGESLIDTVRTVEALGADAVVLRHPEAGAPYLLARHYGGAVVNAGDGRHAHPTQALLDLLTLRDRWQDLRGLRIAIVGDIVHSRVARSTAMALLLCGGDVRLCGPRTLLPTRDWLETLPRSRRGGTVSQMLSLADALKDAQVVMALRMQRERQAAGLIPDVKEYVRLYGLSRDKLREQAPGALVMHPGPVNEGVEISPDLVASTGSLIERQVSNGVLVRMAVLDLLLGGRTRE